MIVVFRGHQAAEVDGHRVDASAGDVLLYRQGEAHEEWKTGRETLETVFLSFEWPSCPPSAPRMLEDAGGRVRLLASWLHEERSRGTAVADGPNAAFLGALLAEYQRLWQHGGRGLFAGLRRHTEQQLEGPVSLAELAAQAGLSRYHYLRVYKVETGRTPMSDVRRVRVDRARDLILTTSLPLKEIAQRSGLGDIYHMTRLFRSLLGVTPGSLRRHSPAR
jgi:AraC-like DNA-binding protein